MDLKKLSVAIYYEYIERARLDEMLMHEKSSNLIKEITKTKEEVNVLDLCCGTGLSLQRIVDYPNIKLLCGVDICSEFLEFAKYRFQNYSNDKLVFLQGNVMDCILPVERWDVINLASAYHHIENDRKVDFLKRVKKLLSDDGFAIVAENILPEYTEYDNDSYNESVKQYYSEVLKTIEESNKKPSKIILDFLKPRSENGYSEDIKDKVSYPILVKHLEEAGLEIISEFKVWPKDVEGNYGNYVFKVKKEYI